ncbi:MAG TPA: DUF6245 family protein [Acidimicrobiia bacterium]|nr:DUF6245 family protein [Acidimicrobiia bacterium]
MAAELPDGEQVVLDIEQLEMLLATTFRLGLDVGAGTEPEALVRLRLSKALLGVVEAQALMAQALAIEAGVPSEHVAAAESLALDAGAYNGIPDPLIHLTNRAMGIAAGVAALEPDPAAPGREVILDAAVHAANGLARLLQFRSDCTTATTPADHAQVTIELTDAAAQLAAAADAIGGLLALAHLGAATGRTGTTHLN